MSFEYKELATKVLFADGNGPATRCQCCDTTQDNNEQGDDDDQGGNGGGTRCQCCDTTQDNNDQGDDDDNQGRRRAQDLTFLRQQLRDALAAG